MAHDKSFLDQNFEWTFNKLKPPSEAALMHHLKTATN